ncbi:DedA family protein [Euzebya rosea]|uniref:DedA family protein n=1 Tax=Euzebya rosea TaxID=2052804 RepID=UPI00196B7667|nr:DedA family protein [Euzebya rosea]
MTSTALLAAAADPSDFTGLVGWVVDVVASGGPVGVALLLALDNVLPVVPSEVVLPFAGYLTSTGDLSFWGVLVAATIGSTASAYVYYEIGRRLGHRRARSALARLPLTEVDDLDRAGDWFGRHGTASVLTGRFVPFVRSVISLPAGTEGMGRRRFGMLTALGSGIWNAVWLWAGAAIGERWTTAGQYSDWMNLAAAVVAVVLIGRYVWRRRGRLPWTDGEVSRTR